MRGHGGTEAVTLEEKFGCARSARKLTEAGSSVPQGALFRSNAIGLSCPQRRPLIESSRICTGPLIAAPLMNIRSTSADRVSRTPIDINQKQLWTWYDIAGSKAPCHAAYYIHFADRGKFCANYAVRFALGQAKFGMACASCLAICMPGVCSSTRLCSSAQTDRRCLTHTRRTLREEEFTGRIHVTSPATKKFCEKK